MGQVGEPSRAIGDLVILMTRCDPPWAKRSYDNQNEDRVPIDFLVFSVCSERIWRWWPNIYTLN
jgi:hypothetical protein